MGWKPQHYATPSDPLRQSDLGDVASQYGCPKRFWFRKNEDAGETFGLEGRLSEPGKRFVGNVVHVALERYLTLGAAKICAGRHPSSDAVRRVVAEVADTLAAELDRPVDWSKVPKPKALEECAWMVAGALTTLSSRAASIELVEAPFSAELTVRERTYSTTGTIDLAFRDRSGALIVADWKTGAQRLHPIIQDHGYQAGLYCHAVEHGVFFEGEDRERRLGEEPAAFYFVHLRDFIPYARATTKTVDRPEEAEFYNVERGAKVKCSAGDARGPGWYRSNRTEDDDLRLRHSVRSLVSGIRRGVFYETIAEGCSRCPFRAPCLEGQGRQLEGEERRELHAALRGVTVTGLEEDEAA